MKINPERLLSDLRSLARFGKSGTGVHRLGYTEADRESRQWLLGRMREAGLDAAIDGIGSVYGRTPGVERAVLIGSHTDSVPQGGWLDGSLGVILGLEVARAAAEAGLAGTAGRTGVDVISFAEEEGHYLGTAGSLSFCGEIGDTEIAAAANAEGRTLTEAIREAGYHTAPRARLDPGRHAAYLEAHIEQGPRLEAENKRIGIVTGIVGIRRAVATFHGRSDHAGTTPMAMREDSGAALIAFLADLTARFREVRGPESVWNFGYINFEPGAGNVVPRRTEVLIEYRDQEDEVIDRMEAAIMAASRKVDGASGVRAEVRVTLALRPAAMDPAIGDLIEQAAKSAGAPWMRMPSGAGHDAQVLARHGPAAMLFIPSVGGRSHDVAEDTSEADIVLGAEVLAGTVERLIAATAD